ncbi:hypothetical protein B0T11DRAFT_142548 [Plectosphaerella cucumerina]|uniref:Uncharacterized protein n=1 Tax=Plectosphaerella cucumerina TaxID=40658 RepID=A0A8K0TAD7_9PEZI|nr:hypothetical protein B0T11DRAFT_142548 [Plectosphaerella cucumerina]
MVGLTKDTASHTIVRHIACVSLNSSDLHSPGSHGCSFSESSPGGFFCVVARVLTADWPEGFDRSIRQIATACRENHSVQSPFFFCSAKDRQRRHSPVILAVRRHRGHFSRCNLKELRPPSWATGRLRALYEVQQQASNKPGPPRRLAVLIYDAASRPPYPGQKVSAERGLGGTARPFLALDGPTKQDASLLRPSHLTIPHHTTTDHKRGLSVPDCENNCTHSTAASPTSLARHGARRSPPGAPDSAC